MLDPVFFFFYHLIQTESLPGNILTPGRSRKMASETFFAKFTEYCEKEGYPTPKDMETVAKIIESVPEVWVDRVEHDHRCPNVQIWTGEIYFPDPDMLKKWLDAYSTVTREVLPNAEFLPKRCSFKAKENGLCMRHQLNKKEYENDGICQANVHYSMPKPPAEPKKRGRPPKTPVDAPFEKEILRQRRQARRRENYKSNPERERASTKRYYWKKKGTATREDISENEKENRRQRRLARRRETYKRRSEHERERERASRRRRRALAKKK